MRGLSTWSAIEQLARAIGRKPRDFGYAGMKDARAVTRQWLSIEHVEPEVLRNVDVRGLSVLHATRHGNKLRLGHLSGNRFRLVLRGFDHAEAERLRGALRELEANGLANYFGAQRFGRDGDGHELGKLLLQGSDDYAPRALGVTRSSRRRVPKELVRLHLSALQSHVFNRVLTRRLDEGLGIARVCTGDVAWIHDRGASFVVRGDEEDLDARSEAFALSPSGPLPGPRMLTGSGEPGRIEREVLAEEGLELDSFRAAGSKVARGARRPLRIPVRDVELEVGESGEMELMFSLPKGSYATTLVGELRKRL